MSYSAVWIRKPEEYVPENRIIFVPKVERHKTSCIALLPFTGPEEILKNKITYSVIQDGR